jgi:hypothetical protein
MIKQLAQAAAIASVALTGVAATPALAHDRYERGDYYGNPYRGDDDDRYEGRHRSHDRDQYRRGYYNNGYYDNRYAYPDRRTRYNNRRCGSGSTGTILGAVAGGLLGREVGRGGRHNRGSTTGLIIGAGAGALVGREIDRGGNCR